MSKSLRSPRHQRLIAALANLRRAKGLSQAETAAKLGRPQSFVAKIERGERRLDVIELIDLVDVLEGDLAALIEHVR